MSGSADSGDEFHTYHFAADVYRKIGFETPLEGQFSRIFKKGARRDPKVAQREPKRAQGRPKASQTGPKAAPKRDKRNPIASRWNHRHPLAPKGSSKEAYIHKDSRSTAPAAAMLLFNMAVWYYGIMDLLHYGTMALWYYGIMALWHYGAIP